MSDLRQHNPPHPGEFIRETFVEPYPDIAVPNQIAKRMGVAPSTFNRLLNKRSDVSPEMAVKLAKVFDTSPEFWLNMQSAYDLSKALHDVNVDEIEPLQFAV